MPFSLPCVWVFIRPPLMVRWHIPHMYLPLRYLEHFEEALFCSLPILLTDCIIKSRDCVVITQRSSATMLTKITSGQEGLDGRKEGGRPRTEEVEEGSYCRRMRCPVYAMSSIFRVVWWHNHRCERFEGKKKNPHDKVLVSFSSFHLLWHHVWAQRELLMCKGRKLGQNEVSPQMQGGFRCH